jgi:hypothetical protein
MKDDYKLFFWSAAGFVALLIAAALKWGVIAIPVSKLGGVVVRRAEDPVTFWVAIGVSVIFWLFLLVMAVGNTFPALLGG